jgi:ureidoglycolate hydrolase
MKKIKASDIDIKSICDFGQLVKMPSTHTEPTAGGTAYFGKLAVLECPAAIQIGLYSSGIQQKIVQKLEQHVQTQEFLFAVSGNFVVPAALSKKENGHEKPDLNSLKAFHVRQGEGILFNEGIWHCSPLPAEEPCTVLVVFKNDTPTNDVSYYDVEEDVFELDI